MDPVTIRVGEGGRVPSGLRHFAMVVEEPRKLAALCRQIRSDLTAYAAISLSLQLSFILFGFVWVNGEFPIP